ncbi:MAG: hypothetical protein PF541_06325, partial [Prolixibacteraceae bacterium]|nr:hypothetical protein [Prolixibacteraceae bacterium]
MNIIVSIKKLSVELMKLEVYYPINKANAQPGQYFNLSTQEDAIPVKAFVDEVKNEKISLIIPHKYQNQLLNISVGDKLYSLNGPYGISFEYKKNESILCLAEGDCVMLYSLIKDLTRKNNKVTTILINTSKNQVLIEKIRQVSNNFQVLTLDRQKLTNNSL